MAIDCWIWGNANSPEKCIEEYQIRLCDEEMKPYSGIMKTVSNRLVSVLYRYGELAAKQCWFAGKISQDMYVVALGGEQNSLLGTRFGKNRGLFCVMAFGFTGEDIAGYRQDSDLFEPLKNILRTLNEKCTGSEETPPVKKLEELQKWSSVPAQEALKSHCAAYRTEGDGCIQASVPKQSFSSSATWGT